MMEVNSPSMARLPQRFRGSTRQRSDAEGGVRSVDAREISRIPHGENCGLGDNLHSRQVVNYPVPPNDDGMDLGATSLTAFGNAITNPRAQA